MVDYSKPTAQFPSLLHVMSSRIESLSEANLSEPINQCTVNEYWPGQGIAAHIGNPQFDSFSPLIGLQILRVALDQVYSF